MTFELMLRFVLGLTLAFGPAITFTGEESAARAMVRERQAEMVAGDIGALRFREGSAATQLPPFPFACAADRRAHLHRDLCHPDRQALYVSERSGFPEPAPTEALPDLARASGTGIPR